jgi:hypothetical protein
MGTGAVSRYKYDRNQKTVTVQDFYCGQMSVSGCKFWQDLSWEQGAAKTMTSPLIIPSVLAFRANFKTVNGNQFFCWYEASVLPCAYFNIIEMLNKESHPY